MKHYRESKIIRTLRIWNQIFWDFIESKLSILFSKIAVYVRRWDKYWDEFRDGSIDEVEILRRKVKIMEGVMIVLLLIQFGMGIVLMMK